MLISNIDKTESYFKENAESWIRDAYETVGFNYPVGFHRVRITKEIICALENVRNVVDIGCGGGHLSFVLSELGYNVLGVDQSEPMIVYANKIREKLDTDSQKRVSFKLCSIDNVEADSFDALTAMGLVGYLPTDAQLFESANKLLRDKGYLIVSFRNRLFNLYSLSNRTIKESETGNVAKLSNEISDLYQQINPGDIRKFIENLHFITKKILEEYLLDSPIKNEKESSIVNQPDYTFNIEARQSTPNEVCQTAKECGFNTLQFYGVHPHLAVPGLNKLLPPAVYNLLSDSLIPLQTNPISLTWSSVFIGVFQKC